MKNSKKVLAVLAAATMAASMGAMVGCGAKPVVTSIDASKVIAVYTFDDLKMNGDELASTTVKAVDANGKELKELAGTISTNISTVTDEAVAGVAWDASVGYMTVPGLPVDAAKGFAVSYWTNGAYGDNDWEIVYQVQTVDIHAGCISYWEVEDHEFITNFFEGTGGELLNDNPWSCLIDPAREAYTFTTITFDGNGNLDYYVNGAHVISKKADGKGNDGVSTIGDVYEGVIAGAKKEVKIGVGNVGKLDNVIISAGLSGEEAVALYNEQAALKA